MHLSFRRVLNDDLVFETFRRSSNVARNFGPWYRKLFIMYHVFTYIGSGFNNQTWSILVHLYPLTYINLHVKYGSNPFWIKKNMKTNYFSLGGGGGGGVGEGGVLGPLYTIHGHRGHQNISKCRPHYSGEICTTSEPQLKNSFSYIWGKNVLFVQFWLFERSWGGGSGWTYLAIQLSFHPYLCTCEISKQSDKNFLS